MLSCAIALLSSGVVAQSNANPDYDIWLYSLTNSITDYRDGPAGDPSGIAAVAFGHSWANCGPGHVPWEDVNPDGTMIDTFPYLAFLVVREHNGRMEQISNRSFVKYSYATFNFSGGPCGACQSGPSGHFRLGCRDTYGASTNAWFNYMGPAEELDPWLGTRDTVGSYWDRGDPPVSGAAATDNRKSLNSSMWNTWSAVKNRTQISEATLMEGGTLYGQAYAVIQGEPVAARDDNIMYRGLSMAWNGSGWNSGFVGGSVQGSVLEAWTGASTDIGGNGNDDGRFLVAVKVTGPVGGLYHYEYAVQNLDNSRGAATFRIPVAPAATVVNAGTKDIDSDGSNDWTFSRVGSEITFSAGVDNALEWNTIYNFWFDSSAAPEAGTTTLDQARPGTGATIVTVGSQVPTDQPGDPATVDVIGSSCPANGMSLTTDATPVLGTTVNLTTSNIPAGTAFGAMILSLGQAMPAIDLSVIGMENCEYHGAGDAVHLPFSSPGSSVVFPVSIPNDNNLLSVSFVNQTFTYSSPATTLGVIGSNGLKLGVGNN